MSIRRVLLLCGFIPWCVQAEIVFDQTMGTHNGGTTLNGDMIIDSDRGYIRGGNLFHSFEIFNVNAGESATFNGPNNVNNIIGRVSGTTISNIDGEIASTIPGASLWLINPNGFVFGAGAWLNVDGSFHVSTANVLELKDGTLFFADGATGDFIGLTSAPPVAFGFTNASAGSITVNESQLAVSDGSALSLVGGDITISGGDDGYLYARGSRINIATTGTLGRVVLDENGIDTSNMPQLGTLTLKRGAYLLSNELNDQGGAGDINIVSENVNIDQAKIHVVTTNDQSGDIRLNVRKDLTVSGHSEISNSTMGNGQAGDVFINAGNVLLVEENSSIETTANLADGRSGDLVINSGELMLLDSKLYNGVSGNGDAGTMEINASNAIIITGEQNADNGIISRTGLENKNGRASDITVNTRDLLMDGGEISSETLRDNQGNSGDISIIAQQLLMSNGAIISATTVGKGNGGQVNISVNGNVTLLDDYTSIESYSSYSGNAGDIALTTNNLLLDDYSLIQNHAQGTGSAGNIDLAVNQLYMTNAQIQSDSGFSGSATGNVTINADSRIILNDEEESLFFRPRISSTSFSRADAGSVVVNAPEIILHAGTIESDTYASGNAGNIEVTTDRLELDHGGTIASGTAASASGNGGNIQINAKESLMLKGRTETVFSTIGTTSQGSGNAGAVTIESPKILVSDYGYISAVTFNQGSAGTIKVNTKDMQLQDGASLIASTGGQGDGGNIIVETDSLLLKGVDTPDNPSGLFTSSLGGGVGGSIKVTAERINVEDGAKISARSTESGKAGSISVAATDSLYLKSGHIITNSENSAGGDIEIQVANTLYLSDSEISASANGISRQDGGGNVSIDPTFVVLDQSEITAKANTGDGGFIDIISNNFVKDLQSDINASSNAGVDGTVVVDAPNQDLTSTITVAEVNFTTPQRLISQPCYIRLLEDQSSFVATGRGLMPRSPDSYRPSLLQDYAINDNSTTAFNTPLQYVLALTEEHRDDCI